MTQDLRSGHVMSNLLGALEQNQLAGDEPFHESGVTLEFDVTSFWRWIASDLVSNAWRGLLAEYLVAHALGVAGGVRVEWDRYDVTTPDGLRVEVKSAAFVQSWKQTRLSAIRFDTAPKTGWDAAMNLWDGTPRRAADVWVFCLLAHEDKATVDPLNVAQWRFFVTTARRLDETIGVQKSIGLARLQQIGALEARYGELAEAVAATWAG